MIRLSIPVRQALARLTLPVLIAAAFALMVVGKADALLAMRARTALSDALVPIYGAIARPVAAVSAALEDARGLVDLARENASLRALNARLERWHQVALALDGENARLKAALHWIPTPTAPFVTARIVADAGGVYARSAMVATPPGAPVAEGAVALDAYGLVGRVTDLGGRSASILLITDINSRIPVVLARGHSRALMVGTNGPDPRLIYWPDGSVPAEGERVVTSGVGGVFPPGLPVGRVHLGAHGTFRIKPAARLARLEMVRLFDYRALLMPQTGRKGP